jgi:hypothetical protein
MIPVIETIAFVAFGIWSIYDGYRIQEHVRRPGMFDEIGPDRYIMVLGILLVVLGLSYLISVQRTRTAERGATAPASAEPLPPPQRITVELLFAFAAYVLIVPVTGYLLATLLFFGLSYWIMGVHKPPTLILVAVLSAAAYGVIFIRLSDMPLPRGMLGMPY